MVISVFCLWLNDRIFIHLLWKISPDVVYCKCFKFLISLCCVYCCLDNIFVFNNQGIRSVLWHNLKQLSCMGSTGVFWVFLFVHIRSPCIYTIWASLLKRIYIEPNFIFTNLESFITEWWLAIWKHFVT